MKVYKNVHELIGHTPIVEISQFPLPEGVRIFAKLEFMNPGGSVKDRAALGMIKGALDRGLIRPGDKLIEATSGNTGIALAMIARLMGLKITLVMPENSELSSSQTMFGGIVVIQPQRKFSWRGDASSANAAVA